MLASFLASNYAFYAANQGYAQSIVYPNYVTPSQFADYSTAMAKNLTQNNNVTSKASSKIQEDTEMVEKSGKSNKITADSGDVKFSIARILGETPQKEVNTDEEEEQDDATSELTSDVADDGLQYSWLQCTRYKPPKLQRIRKRECSKKRKLGRNPRVPFTQQQVAALEQKFFRTHYLSSMDVSELSSALSLTETRVKIWFQNRRARERREREARQRDGMIRKSVPRTQSNEKSWTIASSYTQHSGPAITRIHDALNLGRSAFKPVRLQNYTET